MMVGGRFAVGAQPPRGVSAELIEQIREVESTLSNEDKASKRWTLTWLEGRAVVALDDGPVLRG